MQLHKVKTPMSSIRTLRKLLRHLISATVLAPRQILCLLQPLTNHHLLQLHQQIQLRLLRLTLLSSVNLDGPESIRCHFLHLRHLPTLLPNLAGQSSLNSSQLRGRAGKRNIVNPFNCPNVNQFLPQALFQLPLMLQHIPLHSHPHHQLPTLPMVFDQCLRRHCLQLVMVNFHHLLPDRCLRLLLRKYLLRRLISLA